MAWRAVLLSRRARLQLDRNCCLIEGEDGEIRLAFEDIAGIVLDTPELTLFFALLARLASAKVLVVTSDERHLRNGCLLQGHFRQVGTLRQQLVLGDGLKNACGSGLWPAR